MVVSVAHYTPAIGVDEQGQPPLPWQADVLQRARALDKAHALLVHGPAGAGHLELSLVLAQRWLCEATAAAPCGRCGSCHLVRTRVHPDLLIVVPDAQRSQYNWQSEEDVGATKSEAKPSRDIRVQQVRQAIAWSRNSSGRGRGKVMVLHSADALNLTAANALLKTLEEPPGQLRLLLTSTDPERLLPTVRSRCQRLPIDLPTPIVALAWLAQRGTPDAPAVLALASGSPLEALALAEEGIDAQWRLQLPKRVAAGDASPLLGRPLPRVIELLGKLAHDLLAAGQGAAPRYFEPGSLPGAPDQVAWLAWHSALLQAARHDEHPWQAPLLIESLVTQAAALWPGKNGGPPSTRAVRRPPSLHSAP